MRFFPTTTLLATLLLTCAPLLQASSRYPDSKAIGTVTQTQGFVYKKKKNEKKYTLTSPKIPFTAKDQLKTAKKSTAILRIEGGFQIKLTPSTEFMINKAPNSGDSILNLSLIKGSLYIKVIPSAGDETRGFQLSAGNITLNGSTGSVFVSRQNEADIPKLFIHSKDVKGSLAHPAAESQTFTAGKTLYTGPEGTQEIANPLHKKWVDDLIWAFDGEIEPKFYKYKFPQMGEGEN